MKRIWSFPQKHVTVTMVANALLKNSTILQLTIETDESVARQLVMQWVLPVEP